MSNVIESSKGKEPEATPNRSRAPFQGARSLITIRSIESMESPSLRCSSLGDSMPSISLPTENSIPCNTVRTVQPIRTILITLRYHWETAHPPPAPRSRAPGIIPQPFRDRGMIPGAQLAAPRPARGGQDYPAKPYARKNRHKDKLPSSSARARGPRAPLAPCLRRSARARCTLISLIINRLSHFRATYGELRAGAPTPTLRPHRSLG